jgi:hypothetical protein
MVMVKEAVKLMMVAVIANKAFALITLPSFKNARSYCASIPPTDPLFSC